MLNNINRRISNFIQKIGYEDNLNVCFSDFSVSLLGEERALLSSRFSSRMYSMIFNYTLHCCWARKSTITFQFYYIIRKTPVLLAIGIGLCSKEAKHKRFLNCTSKKADPNISSPWSPIEMLKDLKFQSQNITQFVCFEKNHRHLHASFYSDYDSAFHS